MSHAVVICKLAWYRGGGAKVHGRKQSSWRKHVQYIATRPEADRGDAEAFRVGDDDYEVERSAVMAHARYVAQRPGSSGLFGPDGPLDWRGVAHELEQHHLPAWRVIVSMREEDAARWGMIGRDKWVAAVEAAMPDVAKAMRLDADRVRWVAAYHAKPGQPHAHVVVWEAPHRGARCQGFLRPDERRGVWRAFARELFREERNRLAAEKSAIRHVVRELAGEELEKAAVIVREIRTTARLEVQAVAGGEPGVPPIFREGPEAELARRLQALAEAMPGRGRVALKYMPPAVKAQALDLADWLLRQPGFYDQCERYQHLAQCLARHYSGKQQLQEVAARNARDDLRSRVAQVVLRSAAALNRERRSRRPGVRRESPDHTQPAMEPSFLRRCTRAAWVRAWAEVRREVTRAEARAALARLREVEQAEERAAARRAAEMGVVR